MTRTKSFLALLLIIYSCKMKDHEVLNPAVDKAEIIASLTAPGRYWRFEQITRKVGNETFDLTDDPILVPTLTLSINLQFLTSQEIDVGLGEGIVGDVAYGDQHILKVFPSGQLTRQAWRWDDEKNTVTFEMGGTSYFPEKAYMDLTMLPKHLNPAEAIASGEPERSKFEIHQIDPQLGAVTYTYILRAAWVLEDIPDGSASVRAERVLY